MSSPDGFTTVVQRNVKRNSVSSTCTSGSDHSHNYRIYAKPTGVAVKCWARDIHPSKRFARGGIIPMVEDKGVRHYCMAIDNIYGNITDFGGGISRAEKWLDASIRETFEESHGIFDFTSEKATESVYQSAVAVHDDSNTIILLVKLDCPNYQELISEYREKMISCDTLVENSRIVWIPETIFLFLLKEGATVEREGSVLYPAMYERVRELLCAVEGFYKPLHRQLAAS